MTSVVELYEALANAPDERVRARLNHRAPGAGREGMTAQPSA